MSSASEAERLGFEPCRRCHPNTETPAERSIRAALDYIDEHLDQPITLGVLSRISHLSPNHLHATFLRFVGLSPKAFCEARRFTRFKEHLRLGVSIAEACYAVGYGSSRALYAKARQHLGMTPRAYQRGADRIRIAYSIVATTMGTVLVARTEAGTCAVLVGNDDQALEVQLRTEFPRSTLARDPAVSASVLSVVQSCTRWDPLVDALPLDHRIGIFQARVRKNLGGRSG